VTSLTLLLALDDTGIEAATTSLSMTVPVVSSAVVASGDITVASTVPVPVAEDSTTRGTSLLPLLVSSPAVAPTAVAAVDRNAGDDFTLSMPLAAEGTASSRADSDASTC
jgi:hypothetical protein